MTGREFRFSGLIDGSGRLGAAVPTGTIVIPGGPIELERDRLKWSIEVDKVEWVTPPDSLLTDFIELWNGDDRGILRFAKRWGPLRIDRHGNRLWSSLYVPTGSSRTKISSSGSDSLQAWRFFSRRAYAVIGIASALYQGSQGDPEDWKLLSSDAGGVRADFFGMPDWAMKGMLPGGIPLPGVNDVPLPIDRLRDQISGELGVWLSRYEVALKVVWKETPQIELSYGGHLLSAVALQLTLSILRERSLYTCSGCGVPYSRGARKRPKTGDANFCEKCGRTEALRQGQERRRRKIEKAREMYAAGQSVAVISVELKSDAKTVRNWLEQGARK